MVTRRKHIGRSSIAMVGLRLVLERLTGPALLSYIENIAMPPPRGVEVRVEESFDACMWLDIDR
eukprot:255094-Hanusia_phi.AAC.1